MEKTNNNKNECDNNEEVVKASFTARLLIYENGESKIITENFNMKGVEIIALLELTKIEIAKKMEQAGEQIEILA